MNLSEEFRVYAHYWKPPRFVKFNELTSHGTNNTLQHIFDTFDTKAYTFQRFTGLLDRHGKKIFEGDIVKCREDFNFGDIVNFENGCFFIGDLTITELIHHGWNDFRIIGNILERPNNT